MPLVQHKTMTLWLTSTLQVESAVASQRLDALVTVDAIRQSSVAAAGALTQTGCARRIRAALQGTHTGRPQSQWCCIHIFITLLCYLGAWLKQSKFDSCDRITLCNIHRPKTQAKTKLQIPIWQNKTKIFYVLLIITKLLPFRQTEALKAT